MFETSFSPFLKEGGFSSAWELETDPKQLGKIYFNFFADGYFREKV